MDKDQMILNTKTNIYAQNNEQKGYNKKNTHDFVFKIEELTYFPARDYASKIIKAHYNTI